MNQYDRANILLSRLKSEEMPLHLSEYQVSSQNGENGVILEIIKRVFKYQDRSIDSGTFLEFGCESGKETNMGFFSDWLQWSGSFIESNNEFFTSLNKKYRYSNKIVCHNDFVTKENINGYISENLDVLSIDIDSQDYDVWESVSASPMLVIVEYNSSLEKGKKLKLKDGLSWDGTTAFGASIEAFVHLGHKKGYSLIHTDLAGVNAFFIKDEYLPLFPESESPVIHGPNYWLASGSHPDTQQDVFIEIGNEGLR